MQTLLEIFYMRVVDDVVRYRQKQVDLSDASEDPNQVIQSLIQQRFHTNAADVEDEFVIHSTSWRYAPPDKIILTYVAYCDDLTLDYDHAHSLPLNDLRTVSVSTPRPQSTEELEKQVVSHAMRHIAFLVKTDHENALRRVMAPETLEMFESLWVALAGRVY